MNRQEAQEYLNKLKPDSTTRFSSSYNKLAEIMTDVPELRAEALKAFQKALASERGDWLTLEWAYEALAKIAEVSKPEQIPEILELLKQSVKNNWSLLQDSDMSTFALREFYNTLAKIAKAHPEKIPEILEIYEQGLASEKNDWGSSKCAYKELAGIAKIHPEYTSQIWEVCKKGFALEKDKKDPMTLEVIYKASASFANAHPEKIPEILEVFKQVVEIKYNNAYSRIQAYTSLISIARVAQPEQIPQVLEVFKTVLESEARGPFIFGNLIENYYGFKNLAMMAKVVQPEQIPQVLELFKAPLASKYYLPINDAFESLVDIAKGHPKQMDKILDIYKAILSSRRTDQWSLPEAYKGLVSLTKVAAPEQYKKIVELFRLAKDSPGNTPDVLAIGKESLQASLKIMAQKDPQYALPSSSKNAEPSKNPLDIFKQQEGGR